MPILPWQPQLLAMTEGDGREIAHAFRLGLTGLLSDHEIERFLEALPDPADRFERCFRLAEALRVDLVGDALIDELKHAVAEFFVYAEDVDGMADRLASTRPPDLTLEDGFVLATLVKEAQRDGYRFADGHHREEPAGVADRAILSSADYGRSRDGSVYERGRFRGRTKEGTVFRWNPPELPASALPTNAGHGTARAPHAAVANGSSSLSARLQRSSA